jgi:hypothetical protein
MLPDLSESDLKSLGIDKLGERKRLLSVLANQSSADQPSPKEQSPSATKKRSSAPSARLNDSGKSTQSKVHGQAQNPAAIETETEHSSAGNADVNLAVTKKIDQFSTIFAYCVTTLFFLFLAYGAYSLISIVIKFFK